MSKRVGQVPDRKQIAKRITAVQRPGRLYRCAHCTLVTTKALEFIDHLGHGGLTK